MRHLRGLVPRVRHQAASFLRRPPPVGPDLEKEDVSAALKQFGHTFFRAAVFGALRDLTTIATDVHHTPFHSTAIVLDSIWTGLEFASFPLVNTLSYHLFRPNITTFRAWIPWTVGTSLATAVALRTVEMPLMNFYRHRAASMRGWLSRAEASRIVKFVGMNTVTAVADRVLPDADAMGGAFSRGAASFALGELAGSALATPLLVEKGEGIVSGTVRRCLTTLPLALFDHAVYSAVSRGIDRIAK
jgi:hypothetical protein